MNAKALLIRTRTQNREIGRTRLRQQLRSPENQSGTRIGYDAAAGRYTVATLDGQIQPVGSLTTAAIAKGRLTGLVDGHVDAVPR